MSAVKRIVLDVLKPHHPNILEFARIIAELNHDYRVKVTVAAVDEKTESAVVMIDGNSIEFDTIADTISNMGGSIHSIDEVEVTGAEFGAQAE